MSCLGRVWQILIVVSIFLSTFAFAQVAENSANASAETQTSQAQEIITPSENATDTPPSTDIQPSTDANPLNNSDETPPISDSPINNANETPSLSETNNTLTNSNETVSNENVSNETIIANDTANNSNQTSNDVSNSTDTNNSIILPPVETPTPLLNIDFVYPEKLTRGENFEVKTVITNSGSVDANNVVLSWLLPNGFEKVSEQDSCSSIPQNSSCESTISLKTLLSSNLGLSEIKLAVNYG